jgi:gamma-glutamyltranspeptidase/glutathione hydrolase
MRDNHFPGRSVAHGTRAAVATSQPLASLAAIDILRAGGNAIDAAIAACAVLGVVEPMGTGIGGDCFALCWMSKERRLAAINGSGHAPAALTTEGLLGEGIGQIAETSVHAVTVPGAIDAWCRLNADFGKLPMAALLAPAIDAAEQGFAVTPCIAVEWAANTKKLSADANTKRCYLVEGRAPQAGEVIKIPGLARAMRAVAGNGRDGFYAGEIAREMVACLNGHGGVHTLNDFASQRSRYVEPIRSRYRGVDVVQMPPNAQGLVTLLILNILSGFDLDAHRCVSAERFHLITEATRLAFEVRDRSIADPEMADVPTDHLLSETFARELRARIRLDRAMPYARPCEKSERDTVYVAVADADRNVCSFINSLYFQFGTGLASPESAIIFHNRGVGFRVEPGHPNTVAPRKRPSHTILPGMAFRDGHPWLALGVKGAAFQPIGQASILTAVIDDGLDIQEALDAPRCGYNNDGKVEVERSVPAAVRERLIALGHPVVEAKAALGGAQMVAIDHQHGTLAAASDPRRDGVALCC